MPNFSQVSGLTPFTLVSVAGANPNFLQVGTTQVFLIHAANLTNSPRFLKLYDTAVASTSGYFGQSAVQNFALTLASSGSGGVTVISGSGLQHKAGVQFQNGLALQLTANLALADQSGISAGDCAVNLWFR